MRRRELLRLVATAPLTAGLVSCRHTETTTDPSVVPANANGGEAGIPTTDEDDLAVVRRRLEADVMAHGSADLRDRALDLADRLTAPGTWPDVDYDHAHRTGWKTMVHLERAEDLAIAYRWAERQVEDSAEAPGEPPLQVETLRRAALRALDHWLTEDYQNENWWYNEIGVPRLLYRILLLVDTDLSTDQMEAALRILRRAELGMTGQNLVWLATVNVARACLIGDPKLAERAFGAVEKEVRITEEEGIQADVSFHQHGAILYSGGYGLSFSREVPQMAALARDTRFAFSSERVDLLLRYLLEGQQWMTWGSVMDYSTRGRGISRQGKNVSALRSACEYARKLAPDRTTEIEGWARRLNGDLPPGAGGPRGHRHFWESDFTVHRDRSYYCSVKCVSDRTVGTESGNGEGLKSYHLPDGATFLMRRGDEYAEIFPVWDWRRIPGITCAQTREPYPEIPWGEGAGGTTSFVGGVSDGEYGASTFALEKAGLRGQKSWFFLGEAVVALGTAIRSSPDEETVPEAPVLTSVAQRLRRGDVLISSGGERATLEAGRRRSDAIEWIHHDGIGYLFPDPAGKASATIVARAAEQAGSWHSINRQYAEETIRREVFSAWIDHGTGPEDANYRYVLLPDASPQEVSTFAEATPVEILRNDASIQAVRHRGLGRTQAIFLQAGSLEIPGRGLLMADRPCAVQVRIGFDTVTVSAADPTQSRKRLRLEIGLQLEGDRVGWRRSRGTSRLRLRLPRDRMAGSSVQHTYRLA